MHHFAILSLSHSAWLSKATNSTPHLLCAHQFTRVLIGHARGQHEFDPEYVVILCF